MSCTSTGHYVDIVGESPPTPTPFSVALRADTDALRMQDNNNDFAV